MTHRCYLGVSMLFLYLFVYILFVYNLQVVIYWLATDLWDVSKYRGCKTEWASPILKLPSVPSSR